jgi:DNA-binding beta-propeller fold protein YncE
MAAQPQTVLTIDPKHRIVEGVATDGRTIWISSVLDRQILACKKSCRTLATLPADLHPFAIAWDSRRERLWVAADCPPGVAGITPCERGALVALDQRGTVRTRISPGGGTFHPGDVSVSGRHVFVSDSQNGLVFKLLPTGRAIMAVNLPGDGKSAQGTALTPDGKHLLVADYSRGVGVVDLATFKTTVLPRQDGKPLRGIDGLTRCGSTYFGIYNGAAPGLLVSITRTEAGIEFAQPLGDITLEDPTQIAFDGKRLLIVDNSGWAALDKPATPRANGARILAVSLGADCKPH